MMTAHTKHTKQVPTSPVHQMLQMYPDHFLRGKSRLNKDQQALIRRVFTKSHNTQREVETIAAELPLHERMEWQLISQAFAEALVYLHQQEEGGTKWQ